MKYQVQSGDTMIGISKKFNMPTYKVIADHGDNRALLSKRGGADNLQEGDILNIPENPIRLLEKQLITLTRLKSEMDQFYAGLIQEQKKEYKNAANYANHIDMVPFVVNICSSLGKLIYNGYKALSLSGQELAKANRKLAKDALDRRKDLAEGISDLVSPESPVTDDEGMVLALGKVLVQSWSDMQSPSYWASRFSGVDLKTVNQQTEVMLADVHRKSIQNLDKKIQEKTEQLLALRALYGFEEEIRVNNELM